MLFTWGIWLSIISTLSLPAWISVSFVAIILVFGAQWWTLAEAAFYLLIACWIYSHFTLVPPGFYWLAMYSIYLSLKAVTMRLEVDNVPLLLFLIFFAALFIEFSQIFLFRQIHDVSFWSFSIFSSVFLSGIIQTLFCALVAKYLLVLVTK
jgi:hypothetical protein